MSDFEAHDFRTLMRRRPGERPGIGLPIASIGCAAFWALAFYVGAVLWK
jgi:hypothetical protein